MAPPRKALIAVTSARVPFFYSRKNDKAGMQTGLWIGQALQAFQIFRKAGFEVDLVSEQGVYFPDWLSVHKEWLEGEEREIYENRDSELRSKLDHLMTPGEIREDGYGLFFAAGGHAALMDFPDAKGLQDIASKMYMAGGIVSAVSHGGVRIFRSGSFLLESHASVLRTLLGFSSLFCTKPWVARQSPQANAWSWSCSRNCFVNPMFRPLFRFKQC